ncbi:MAG: hypothetical protein IKT60_01450 [Clostridia bacterium]|nr:hypothetical protein [Clostridia bacterium]
MRKNRNLMRANFGAVGIASLIVCFAVLCMTVLSVSAFVAARDGLRDAEAVAVARKNFYAADLRAVEITVKLKEAYLAGANLSELSASLGAQFSQKDGEILVAFGVPVDDMQTLSVLLAFENEMKICSWQVLPSTDWLPDDSISVWHS